MSTRPHSVGGLTPELYLRAQTSVLSRLSSRTTSILADAERADAIRLARASLYNNTAPLAASPPAPTAPLNDSLSTPVACEPGAAPALHRHGGDGGGGEERASTLDLRAMYEEAVHERGALSTALASTSAASSRAVEEYEARLRGASARVAQLEAALAAGRSGDAAAVEDARREAEGARRVAAAAAHDLTLAAAQVSDLRRRVEEATRRAESAEGRADKLHSSARQEQAEGHAAVRALHASTQEHVGAVSSRLRACEAELVAATSALTASTAENGRLCASNAELRAERERLRAAHDADTSSSSRVVDDTRGELSSARAALASQAAEVALLREQAARLAAERKEAAAEAESRKEQLAAADRSFATKAAALQDEARRAGESLSLAHAEVGRLRAQLVREHAKLADVERAAGDAQRQALEAASSHERELAELGARASREQRGEVERVRRAAEAHVADATAEAGRLRERCASLEADVASGKRERAQLVELARRERVELSEEHARAFASLRTQQGVEARAVGEHVEAGYAARLADVHAVAHAVKQHAAEAVAGLQHALAAADERCARALGAAEDYKRRVESGEGELGAARAALEEHRAALQAERLARHNEAVRVDAELHRLSSAIVETEQRLAASVRLGARLQEEGHAAAAQTSVLRQQHEATRVALAQADAQLAGTRRHLGDTQAQVSALERALAADQAARAAEVSALQAQLHEMVEARKDASGTIVSQRSMLAAEREEVVTLRALLSSVQGEVLDLRAALAEQGEKAEQQATDARAAVRLHQDSLARAVTAEEATYDSLHEAQRDIAALQDTVGRLRAEAASAEAAHHRVCEEACVSAREVELLRARLLVAKQSHERAESRADGLAQEREAWLATEVSLREEGGRRGEEARRAADTLTSALGRAADLTLEVDRLKRQVALDAAGLSASDEKAARIASVLSTAKDDAERVLAESARERGRADAARAQLQDALYRADTAERRVSDAEQGRREAESRSVEAEHTCASLRRELGARASEAESLTTQLGTLMAEAQRGKRELTQAQLAGADVRRSAHRLETALSTVNSDAEHLRAEVARLRAERDGAAAETEAAKAQVAKERARAEAAESIASLQHSALLDTSASDGRSGWGRGMSASPGRTVSAAGRLKTPGRAGGSAALQFSPSRRDAGLQERIASLKDEIGGLKVARETAEGEGERVRSALNKATVELSKVKDELAHTQGELDRAKKGRGATSAPSSPRASDRPGALAASAPPETHGGPSAQVLAQVRGLEAQVAHATAHIAEMVTSLDDAVRARESAGRERDAAEAACAALQERIAGLVRDAEGVRAEARRAVAEAESRAMDAIAATEVEMDGSVARAEERVAEAGREAGRRAERAGKAAEDARAVVAVREAQLARLSAAAGEYARGVGKLASALGVVGPPFLVEGGGDLAPGEVTRSLSPLLEAASALRALHLRAVDNHGGGGSLRLAADGQSSLPVPSSSGLPSSSTDVARVRSSLLAYGAPLRGDLPSTAGSRLFSSSRASASEESDDWGVDTSSISAVPPRASQVPGGYGLGGEESVKQRGVGGGGAGGVKRGRGLPSSPGRGRA